MCSVRPSQTSELSGAIASSFVTVHRHHHSEHTTDVHCINVTITKDSIGLQTSSS